MNPFPSVSVVSSHGSWPAAAGAEAPAALPLCRQALIATCARRRPRRAKALRPPRPEVTEEQVLMRWLRHAAPRTQPPAAPLRRGAQRPGQRGVPPSPAASCQGRTCEQSEKRCLSCSYQEPLGAEEIPPREPGEPAAPAAAPRTEPRGDVSPVYFTLKFRYNRNPRTHLLIKVVISLSTAKL